MHRSDGRRICYPERIGGNIFCFLSSFSSFSSLKNDGRWNLSHKHEDINDNVHMHMHEYLQSHSPPLYILALFDDVVKMTFQPNHRTTTIAHVSPTTCINHYHVSRSYPPLLFFFLSFFRERRNKAPTFHPPNDYTFYLSPLRPQCPWTLG